MMRTAAVALALIAAAVALLGVSRSYRLASIYRSGALHLSFMWHGITVVRNQMIEMEDGVRLATDLYLPDLREEGLPTLLVRLPYDKTAFGGALQWVRAYAPLGYAVVLQDLRGRYSSEGEFTPYERAAEDGSATLDWIARQPWSNGRIGTAGCSALGEVQAIQAKTRNPHLSALIAEGAGGAIGSGGPSRGYFGIFQGGVPNLAATFGWFALQGGKTPDQMRPADVKPAEVLGELPSGTLVARHRESPTDYEDFMARFEDEAYWERLGYLSEVDRFAAPALHVNTWQDIAVRGTFEVAALMRSNAVTDAARNHQHVIIGPGLHCDFAGAFAEGRIGDIDVDPASGLDLDSIYRAWLDHWLRDGPEPELAPYTYFVMGANRWETSEAWPPATVRPMLWFLAEGGTLGTESPPPGQTRFRYDPMDPTPSIGGPICCTGDPRLRAGPLDQRPNAGRADVLAFASEPLDEALTIVGDVRAQIAFSSDAPDTDLIAVLVDVAPDGSMVAVTQGALRLRYRDGFDTPRPLQPGVTVMARVDLAPIAYEVEAGHRLGLHLSSSSFPRLERNLNGPGPSHEATEPRIATNTVHFGGEGGSVLILPIEG